MKRNLAVLMTLLMLSTGISALAVDVSGPGELPIVSEPVTLTFLVTEHPGIIDWESNEFILWLEEQTGVNLEFDYVPLAERSEKLNLILATGDYPDVFFGMGGDFSSSALRQYGEQGMLLPLNDLIDEHCVEVHKIFEQFPGSRELITQLDGNIYSMPNVNECYHCTMAGSKYWMNRQWLDNLGLEAPTTIDEFYDVLVAFRDQDANGNGDKNDEIPMAGAYTSGWYTRTDMFIMNAFTYYDLELASGGATVRSFGLYLDGDTVVTPFDQPAFKDGLKFINKLVDEGLYYEGSFTQGHDQLTQLAENESANLLGGTTAGYNSFTQMGDDRYREYDMILPLTGPDGYQNQVIWPYISVGSANNYVISADCEYPEVAIKVADFCLTLEASLRAYYGVEGIDWKWAEEGQIGMNGKPAIYEQLTAWSDIDPQNHHITQYGLDKRDADFRFGVVEEPDTDLYSGDGLELYLLRATQSLEPYAHSEYSLPPVKFTTEEEENLAVIRTELSTSIKEGVIAFMIGSRDVDKDYDSFMADLEAKGLRTLTDAYQKAYNEQYK